MTGGSPVAPAFHAATPDPGPLIVAKAAAAGLFAAILAAADLAAVLPSGSARLAGRWVGVAGELTLADWQLWIVVLCVVAEVSLFSVIGVGLAALAGRWWLVGGSAGVLSVASLAVLAGEENLWPSGDTAETTMAGLLLVVAVPAAPWAVLWYLNLSPWAPLALALTLATAFAAIALGCDAARRRVARAGPAPALAQDAAGDGA